MTQHYRKFKRARGIWYAFGTATGNFWSLKSRVKAEAVQKVSAMNETDRQSSISFGLARVYLNAIDPRPAMRIWQEVTQNIAAKKTDDTRCRWAVEIKHRYFDWVLAEGKVSSAVHHHLLQLIRHTSL